MEVVRLTNLGNLTLRSMLNLEQIYEENSSLRRERLTRLWPSKAEMEMFEFLFTMYHLGKENSFLTKEGNYYVKRDDPQYEDHIKGINQLMQRYRKLGLVRFIRDSRPPEVINQDVKKDGYTNPIKYVIQATIELTGLCNLNCRHCYRGGSREEEYGLSAEEIKKALEPLLRAGVVSISFIGAEPKLREDDLFEIIDYASPFLVPMGVGEEKSKKPETTIGVYTNGNFNNQIEFVRKVKSYGNVGLQTSLDCYDEKKTDRNRGKGVFAKVKNLARICKEEGLELRLGMLCDSEFLDRDRALNRQLTEEETENMEYFYGMGVKLNAGNIIQLGNAVQANFNPVIDSSSNYFGALSSSKKHKDGWCKGFTRPDRLHIRPTGNVGNCNYAYGFLEEFGNLKSSSMIEILNRIQNTRIYQMFKDGSIERYQYEIDRSLFQKPFSGSCEIAVITAAYGLVKERLMREGVANPTKMANEEVARTYKFIN
jgi:sulfatase maturation enzyme AslB (radical SAM superfamily)